MGGWIDESIDRWVGGWETYPLSGPPHLQEPLTGTVVGGKGVVERQVGVVQPVLLYREEKVDGWVGGWAGGGETILERRWVGEFLSGWCGWVGR